MNPLVPTAVDVAMVVVVVVVAAITVIAFVSWVRTRGLGSGEAFLWLLVIVALPVIGPSLWFVRRSRRRASAAGDV